MVGVPSFVRPLFFAPLSLKHLENQKGLLSIFSMRFDKRCSGAPFFADGGIVGILQGSFERNNSYAGLRMVEFTPPSLALINALISDPRGLLNIPQTDLEQMVKLHMFALESERKSMREKLQKEYLK